MGSLLQGIFWAYSKPIRNILGIFMAFLRYVCGWFRCAPCRWRISAPGRSPSAELCWRWWRFACWRHLAVATTEVSEDVRTNGKRWPCEHMITHAYVFICLHMSSICLHFPKLQGRTYDDLFIFIQSRGRFRRSPLSRHCSNIRWISWRLGRRLIFPTNPAILSSLSIPLLCLGIPIQIHCILFFLKIQDSWRSSCAPGIIANGTAIKFEIRCISIEWRNMHGQTWMTKQIENSKPNFALRMNRVV